MNRTVPYYVGLFLKIFTVVLLFPVFVGKLYGESFVRLEGFIFSAFIAIVLAELCSRIGEQGKPDAVEGMMAALIGWLIAVGLGGVPLMTVLDWSFINAFFEAMSAMTTTGMSLLQNFEGVPKSLLFWRAFMQWIGGLGILTFFVAVVVEAGGAATALVSAESNKTGSGSIRPSLMNAVKSLWYIYIVFTALEVVALYAVGMDFFNSLLYSLTTMPTGGFANSAGGIAAFNSVAIESVITVFMVIGGTNFLLLYSLMKGNVRALVENYEFRLYIKIMAAAVLIVFAERIVEVGGSVLEALRISVFQVAAVTSSTGFEPYPAFQVPEVTQLLFIFLMFVGASLGSTTGGIKMFRLGVLLKVVVREVRSFSMPRRAMNLVMTGGKRVKQPEIMRIFAIVVTWAAMIFLGGIITVALTELTIVQALQGMTSSMGTMGPLMISQEALIGLPAVVKLLWAFGMLAGRLELLPILVLLNVELSKLTGR